MRQDLRLESRQVGAGLEPQLAAETAAQPAVRAQRVRLAPGGVQGAHQLAPQPLTEGMLSDERLELADQLTVTSEADARFDPVLQRVEATLVEAPRLRLDRRLLGDLAIGRAAPESERRLECIFGVTPSPLRQQRLAMISQPLETRRVDVVVADHQAVSGPLGSQHTRRAHAVGAPLADQAHVVVHHSRRTRRRGTPPERLHQRVHTDRAAASDEKDRDEQPLLRPRQRDGDAVDPHLERTQDTELHRHSASPQRHPTIGRRGS